MVLNKASEETKLKRASTKPGNVGRTSLGLRSGRRGSLLTLPCHRSEDFGQPRSESGENAPHSLPRCIIGHSQPLLLGCAKLRTYNCIMQQRFCERGHRRRSSRTWAFGTSLLSIAKTRLHININIPLFHMGAYFEKLPMTDETINNLR